MAQNIMIYLDGTETSLTAVEYGIYLTKKLNASIYVLFVIDSKTLEDLLKSHIFVKSEELDFEHDLEKDGKRYLKEAEMMGKEKGVKVTTILSKGEVNEEAIKAINEHNIDLLILGDIEFTQSRSDTFYSETERIFRRAKCPVLIVKDEEKVHDLFDKL